MSLICCSNGVRSADGLFMMDWVSLGNFSMTPLAVRSRTGFSSALIFDRMSAVFSCHSANRRLYSASCAGVPNGTSSRGDSGAKKARNRK